ncbi:MAG TPA: glycosyltransferase family 2 protein, partial [Myxococcaceae bacterium]|nr:glycosyltransferase family 2 protein [Myxococcaceae bacterium]
MSRELVSVIIPTYNRSWGLRLAMRSVLAQDYEDFELLVVDDASPDDTPRVVAEVEDSRLRYVRQPTNVGMTRNWGHGVTLARGEYLVLLADDDQLGPGFLSQRVAALRGHPSRVVAFSDYEVRDR